MGRLVRAWFAPLQIFDRGLWNIALNLFGTAVLLGGLAWLKGRFGIAAGLSFVLFVLLMMALAALWKEVATPHEPATTFAVDDQHRSLTLHIQKPGPALRRATILLTVPGSFGSLRRLGADDVKWSTVDSDGNVVWEEKNLEIDGGGRIPTRWRFQTLIPPGEHDLLLVISDDSLSRPSETQHRLCVQHTSGWQSHLDRVRDQRLAHVERIRQHLEADKRMLAGSMAAAVWRPGDSRRFHSGGRGVPQLKPDDSFLEASDVEVVNRALLVSKDIFDVYSKRLNSERSKARDSDTKARQQAKLEGVPPPPATRDSVEVPLKSGDGMEQALVQVDAALLRIDAAIKNEARRR